MPRLTSDTAREHLLDVAEKILASKGLQALTIRELTQAAGVNLATVNYVFGTKDSLLIGLLQRMLRPMTFERLRRFDALEAAGNPALREVVSALVEPLAQMREQHGTPAVELYRYLVVHPDDRVRTASWELLEPGLRRFEELVELVLPDRPPTLVHQQVHLVCQVVVPTALRALDVFDQAQQTGDLDALIDFVAGGLDVSTVGARTNTPSRIV